MMIAAAIGFAISGGAFVALLYILRQLDREEIVKALLGFSTTIAIGIVLVIGLSGCAQVDVDVNVGVPGPADAGPACVPDHCQDHLSADEFASVNDAGEPCVRYGILCPGQEGVTEPTPVCKDVCLGGPEWRLHSCTQSHAQDCE